MGSLRFPVAPMKATLATLPVGDDWAYEIKWDGYRTVVFVDDGHVRLQSSSGKDVTTRWPELAGFASGVNAGAAILDAELVVYDADGVPRFELVQNSGAGSPHQAVLQVFDVLSVNGTDTIAATYDDRRRLLGQLVEPGDHWGISTSVVGDGEALLTATVEQGLEGVMAKRRASTYQPGARTRDWRKVKNRRQVTLTIGGWTEGTGNRAGTFGALLVGRREGDRLAFAGGVGTGFDQRRLESLTEQLRASTRDDCPFDPAPPRTYLRGAHWVEPDLEAVVEIAEFTNEGFVRHASFLRLTDE